MLASGTAANKQYDYDHREDRAYYLDKAYVERGLETWKNAFEEEKVHANGMAGPAVIEVFGEEPFSPETKKEAFRYGEKQQQLCVYEMSQRGQITNQYIKGGRSAVLRSLPTRFRRSAPALRRFSRRR